MADPCSVGMEEMTTTVAAKTISVNHFTVLYVRSPGRLGSLLRVIEV